MLTINKCHNIRLLQSEREVRFVKKIDKKKCVVRKCQVVNVATPSYNNKLELLKKEDTINLQGENQVFSWTKQWYPIQGIVHLDASRPTGVQLLGKDLVIWRDGEGNWVCFEDQCPHRLVPLSEGRLETDGTLQCAYHAWRFNAKGECVYIPQAESENAQNLCSNKKSCAKVYPTCEKYGLLWIWGECGTDSHLESLLHPPSVPSALDSQNQNPNNWQIRNLPYSHETLLENVIDPAHVPVSHHGEWGFNRKNAKPFFFKMETPIHAQKGFELLRFNDKNKLKEKNFEGDAILTFIPPSVIKYTFRIQNLKYETIAMATPITEGECRLFLISVSEKNDKNQVENKKSNKISNFIAFALLKLQLSAPQWMAHLQYHNFFQQDNVFLYKQEKFLKNKKNLASPISKLYYMPTMADLGVNFFHKWLAMHAYGGVQYAPDMVPKEHTENDLTDVYNNHTKNCKYCMGALDNFKKLQVGSWVACAICATCVICSVFVGPMVAFNVPFGVVVKLPPVKVLILFVLGLIFGMLGIYVNNIIPKFYKAEFSHADN